MHEQLTQAVGRASSITAPLSLAMLDIDRLKFLNDCFGHRSGDAALNLLAESLVGASANGTAFRVGGDEFALLLPGVDAATAERLLKGCLEQTRRGSSGVSITVGVATLAAGEICDPAVLSERATTALQEGKRSSRGAVVSFESIEQIVTVVTPGKVTALCSLLEDPRLEIVFQPIWDLENDCLLGLEALARPWSGYGFEGPAEMFHIAEKIGRAHDLDAICVSATLARARELPPGALLFLNVNPQSLAHGTVHADLLAKRLEGTGLSPQRIVIEITEQSDARLDVVVARANELHARGFKIALDDVGVGNAGIELMCELPVDYVKLDRSVISKVLTSVQARAVLIAVALFAYRVDAYVIAEGIETQEVFSFVQNAHHLDMLRDPPITGAQGYLLGRPTSDIRSLPASAEDALPKPPPPLPLPPELAGGGEFAAVA